MRLLHVYSGNLYGGIEALLVTTARARAACAALQHEVALCFDGRLRAELEATGMPVHRLPEVRASRPHTVRGARQALAALLAARRFDRVICHASWSQALFGGVVKRAGVPLAVWAHDAATGRHWTERWARRVRPDLVLCNSRFTAGSVAALYPSVSAVVVMPPVDLDQAAPTREARAAVRAAMDTPAGATVIIQISRMQAWKGHATVLEALARLRGVTDWIWWIAGGAQRREEAAYLESLRASVRRLDLAGRVRFLGERRDVKQLLAAADIHCQANIAPEPFGIAYVEALAAGLPVVASRAGGALEIVDESCGVLVPPGDVEVLAAALGRLIVDRAFRSELAGHAPARARRLCDPAMQLQRLADALTDMSDGRGRPARVGLDRREDLFRPG